MIETSDAAVLLTGETGTDKEVCESGHLLSGKATYPLVPFNYGSLPDSLPEDESFVQQRGAFADAQAHEQSDILPIKPKSAAAGTS